MSGVSDERLTAMIAELDGFYEATADMQRDGGELLADNVSALRELQRLRKAGVVEALTKARGYVLGTRRIASTSAWAEVNADLQQVDAAIAAATQDQP